MPTKTQLERTPETARQCGVSTQTLMRYRDDQGGFLGAGIDYFYGAHPNSPIRWNVSECLRQINHRGKLNRRAKKFIEEA